MNIEIVAVLALFVVRVVLPVALLFAIGSRVAAVGAAPLR